MSKLIEHITPDNLQLVQDMASCNFGPSDIALQLGVEKNLFLSLFNMPNSDLRQAYEAGKTKTQFELMNKQRELGIGGNITATQIFLKESQAVENKNILNECLY